MSHLANIIVSSSSTSPSKPDSDSSYLSPDEVLHGRFKIRKKIEGGEGSFGVVYLAFDKKLAREVAVKVDKKKGSSPGLYTMLHREHYVLYKLRDAEGFPRIHFFGRVKSGPGELESRMLVMDRLGPSLHSVCKKRGFKFSCFSMLTIIDQLLDRIESMHKEGFIHRDIKPKNILFGMGPVSNVVYLIDFGLTLIRTGEADEDGDSNTLEELKFVGTPLFMSIRAHLQLKQNKKDDLESLVYVLAYILNGGDLPWSNKNWSNYFDSDSDSETSLSNSDTISVSEESTTETAAADDDDEEEEEEDDESQPKSPLVDKHEKMCAIKMSTPMDKLFAGLPLEFTVFGNMVRNLNFGDEPSYQLYRNMFRTLGALAGVKYNV